MKLSTYFSKQARKPSGIFGRFYMSRIFDKGNFEMNSFVFEKLSAQESDRILEIGCGTGQLLNTIAKELKEGIVEGIDFSKPMVSIAKKTNKKYIKNEKVKIHQGNFDDFPFELESFDKIISVNTIYFWENPQTTISKIMSLLKLNGMLILGFHDKAEMEKINLDNTIFELFSQQDVIELLTSKGKMDAVEILIQKGKGKTNYCAIGIKQNQETAKMFKKTLIHNNSNLSGFPKIEEDMTEICVFNNQIESLPDELWKLKRLEVLNISANKIKIISNNLGDLQNLRMIDFGHNQIEELPRSIGNLIDLDSFVYLHNNCLKELPDEITRLRKIKYLNISQNRIENLPENIGSLRNLIEFKAEKNQLSHLPSSFIRLTNLLELNLSNNKLESLSDGFSELKKLRILNLEDNSIEHLPVKNYELRELYLRNNKIKEIPCNISKLKELRKIDLRGNQITNLPKEILELENIERIDLRWNPNIQIPEWLNELELKGCIVYY